VRAASVHFANPVEPGNVHAANVCFKSGAPDCCCAQIRCGHLMARRRESNRFTSNTARAVQRPERPVGELRLQDTVKNLRLTVNRAIPVPKDQLVVGRK
jgi:hypothetical protein